MLIERTHKMNFNSMFICPLFSLFLSFLVRSSPSFRFVHCVCSMNVITMDLTNRRTDGRMDEHIQRINTTTPYFGRKILFFQLFLLSITSIPMWLLSSKFGISREKYPLGLSEHVHSFPYPFHYDTS